LAKFTLKQSGRKSPYFFNAGLFQHHAWLGLLGDWVAFMLRPSFTVNSMISTVISAGLQGHPLGGRGQPFPLMKVFDRDVPSLLQQKGSKDHGRGPAAW